MKTRTSTPPRQSEPDKPTVDSARRPLRRRVGVIGALLMLFACSVMVRAYRLQVREAATLRGLAEDHYRDSIRLSPMRGTIYDRHGAELAVSVRVESVSANPREMRAAGRDPAQVTALLRSVVELDEARVLARLSSDRRFVWIARRVTPQQANRIRAMEIPGVRLEREARRFYPNRELASHVLGFADIDGVGIEGLELSFEERLRGSNAVVPAVRDRRGNVVFSEQLFDDRGSQGDGLVLTIDKTIQHIVERELALAVSTFEARAGSVVVMDPHTGEILAMASFPTFNPNTPQSQPVAHHRNRAVTDRFEPGSTVKPFTIAAALDVGSIRTDQLIDCQNGAMEVAEYTIHDSHPYAQLTPAQILAFSSNIGTAKIAQGLGRAGLYRAFRRFGFGQTTGLPLPGETAGILRHYRRWYEMDAATISFGQGMSSTTVQLASAMSALANGGDLVSPVLVRRIVDGHGETLEETRPNVLRRVVRPDTARLVADMLTAVTGPGGTGEDAAIDGFLVAGKTGTAQKANYIGGGYADDRWLASFVGFVPAEAPRIVIAVVIDEPLVAHYGGVVAGPVFRRVGEATLRHLGVATSEGGQALTDHERQERARAREVRRLAREARALAVQARVANGPSAREAVPPIALRAPEGDEIRVPLLVGRTARASIVALLRDGLSPTVDGSGVVASQDPAAGTLVAAGARVRLTLARPELADAMVLPTPEAEVSSATASGTTPTSTLPVEPRAATQRVRPAAEPVSRRRTRGPRTEPRR
jgi:cell division protein FtsI (penicillin-binding protein 3)